MFIREEEIMDYDMEHPSCDDLTFQEILEILEEQLMDRDEDTLAELDFND